ncbi:hypothetical protein F5Y14DRAFT_413895 [Nemania sp. NC0429]|nr:hypothetical protein F5Y14DRAFT_413895 [Nemania sp. NC0429]
MQSPPTSDHVVDPFDPSRPFHGLVLCCTNIEADQRSEIAQRTADMGGVHKYDLTPDVTHLIVGDYSTPKYRHVAKERPDIKPMAAGWVDAVRTLWMEDHDFDFAALESTWKLQPFEAGGGNPSSLNPAERGRQRLRCCLTGFEDNDIRAMIEDKVKANGGEYVADLTRQVTHLIVSKPEGKKYSAAHKWGIYCVSIEWLHDSVERGMILNEECYDPTLPPEERGKGAWSRRDPHHRISLGKRSREHSIISTEGASRKLRKQASIKINSQSKNIWGDILNQSAGDLSRSAGAPQKSSEPAASATSDPGTTEPVTSETTQPTEQHMAPPPRDRIWPALRKGVFAGCRFFVHGFPTSKEQILFNFLTSHDGQVSPTLEDVASSHHTEPLNQRYLLVPQTSQPDSHPQLPDGVHIITEFFIERCIHNKTLSSPTDHVWGQPFPRFPVDGFQKLTICTAGFVNEQLNHVEKTVTQLGATYSEKLNRNITLLLCPDLASLRQQKRDLAIFHNIPIINAEWLWQCISTGCLVPWDDFQFEELIRSADSIRANLKRREQEKKNREALNRSRSEPVPTKVPVTKPGRRAPAPPPRAGVDRTAFESDTPRADRETNSLQRQNTHESHYETAPTHPGGLDDAFATAPLSETTISHLNKAVSSPKPSEPENTVKRFPTEGEVGDSEAGDDSDATTRKEPTNPSPETERRRKVQEARDLERLELSKRLNSLMADDAVQEGSGPPRPARRKREILGRATSNVSVTSTASADSSLALSGSGPRSRQLASALPTVSASGETEFDKFLEHGKDRDAEPENPPPATQLEYEDLQAKKYRQVVVGKMMGRGKLGGRSKSEGSKSEGGSREEGEGKGRLRVTDPPASAKLNSTKETGATRRTTRRQGR